MDRKAVSVLFAGVVVVLGLVASALGVAGITNISAARMFLVAAWAAAIITVTTAEAFVARSIKNVMTWGVIVALVAGIILFGIDRWMIGKKNEKELEAKHLQPVSVIPQGPVNIADQIARSRKDPTVTNDEPLVRTIHTKEGVRRICINPPVNPALNWWPVTYSTPAEICHDLPLIDGRTINGEFSQSKEDLLDGLTAHNGETVNLLIWISNGAANNLDPAVTLARNLSVTTSTDTSLGTKHYIKVAVAGDNVETIYGQFIINTNPNEWLEIIPKSGQVLNYTSDKLLSERFDMGNNTVKIGDLRPNWEDGLFIIYGVRVVASPFQ